MPSYRDPRGIEIFYESAGPVSGPAVCLVAGLGAQLIWWPEEFVAALVEAGCHVIRADNRDVGLSSHFDEAGLPDLLALGARNSDSVAYHLEDMADDIASLLRGLGVLRAHLVGVSMGGMIAQTVAIRHPDLVASLCSVSSTTSDPTVGLPHPEAIELLLRPGPSSEEEAVAQSLDWHRTLGSKACDAAEEDLAEKVRLAWRRSHHPEGTLRQLAAVVVASDRTEQLRRLRIPAAVVHGADDKLIDPSGARATAAAIPGSRLRLVEGVGHDFPRELWEVVVEEVLRNIELAEGHQVSD